MRNNRSRAELLLIYISKTICECFPDFKSQLNSIPDNRVVPIYSMADVVFSVISMFLLKAKSRNSINENRMKSGFLIAFARIFNYKMPHLDTSHDIIKKIDPEHLGQVLLCLVKAVLARKTLHPFRLLSRYHVFAIDGVKVVTFSEKTEGVTTKISKNGVESYTRSCLQVKITTENGFAIPVMTEWISTEDGQTKEDCELNAFKRLTKRLHKIFPKLPVCLVLDGLYANDSVFGICSTFGWKYIVTLKDKSLKSLWRTIVEVVLSDIYPTKDRAADSDNCGFADDDIEVPHSKKEQPEILQRTLEWINGLGYKTHVVNWFACSEFVGEIEAPDDTNYFAFLTNLVITKENIVTLEKAARYGRAGIENSFNTEKNRGYAMKHKYARKSFNAARNYLTCMHIAEIINQIVSLSLWFREQMLENAKSTLKDLWDDAFKTIRHMNEIAIENASLVIPETYSYQ